MSLDLDARRPPRPPVWVAYYHIFYTLIFCAAGIIIPCLMVRNLGVTELWIIPVTFIIANFVEYFIHRFPMHNRYPFADHMLKLHMLHHNYFYEDAQRIEIFADYGLIVFPPLVLNMIAFVLTPIFASLAWWLFGRNTGLLFIASIMGYYFLMQILHVATHLNDDNWIARLPGIRYLWVHHQIHHTKKRMHDVNFNFIVPLADWIIGTGTQKRN